MMIIEIAIPTYRRVKDQKTYKKLPKFLQSRTTFVVREDEVESFKEHNPGTKILTIPSDTRGIPETRKLIAKHWENKRVLVLEDDLGFRLVKYNPDGSYINSHPDELDWVDVIEDIGRLMDEGYVYGGFQPPGNQPNPEDKKYRENTRVMYSNWYSDKFPLDDIDFLGPINDSGKVEIFPEDMYVNLQLLTKGYKNMVLDYFRTEVTSSVNAPGGCSDIRTIENHNAGSKWLESQFPDFVKVKMKQTKHGAWANQDKAGLTIQWKKAYQSSQEDKDESSS